jgi:hypothetical protein
MPQMNGRVATYIPNEIIVVSPFDPAALPIPLQECVNFSGKQIWLFVCIHRKCDWLQKCSGFCFKSAWRIGVDFKFDFERDNI